MCVPSCSFSSKIPKKEDECYVFVDQGVIPPGIFDETTEVSLLRLGRPKCIESYQYKEYRGTLTQFPALWQEVCYKVHTIYGLNMENFRQVCDCNCLNENQITLEYCSQDLHYLYSRKCKNPEVPYCKLCSCCGYNFDNMDCTYEKCPNCNDNTYIIHLNNQTGEESMLGPLDI